MILELHNTIHSPNYWGWGNTFARRAIEAYFVSAVLQHNVDIIAVLEVTMKTNDVSMTDRFMNLDFSHYLGNRSKRI